MVERTAEEKKPPGLIQGSNKNFHILVLFIEGGLKVSEVSFCCFVLLLVFNQRDGHTVCFIGRLGLDNIVTTPTDNVVSEKM